LVLVAGLLFTGFIVIFVLLLQRRQSDLEKLVDERTQEVFKQENLIKTISDNLPMVSYRCTADDSRKFTFLSSEIINLIGIAPSDFLVGNKSYYDYIHPNDVGFVKKSIEEASINRQHFDIEYRVIGRKKEVLWVNERGHMAFDQEGKPLWIDGTIADITVKREAAAKLNESLYELEKANAELKLQTERANQFAEEARIADETKSQFFTNMSHEIRTPINAIIGMSGLLKETEQTEIQQKYTDIICSSSENLLAIINDILDFSKMEAGKMHFENICFNLSDCVNDVVKMLIIRAAQKNLKLRCNIDSDVPLFLKGDPHRLRQVIINLVSNAIKFTEKGSVDIHVSLSERYGDDVLLMFVVADTGIGIEKKDIGKLFNLFVQADGSTARKYGGTGLGLAISKQIVEHFNGRIGVESEFGKGSEFWFTSRFTISDKNESEVTEKESEPIIASCLSHINDSVIDRIDLTKRLLNDEALIKNVINTFNNVAPGIIETLRFAVEAENYELAKEQAHSLKGSAATISAYELEKLASELENYYINSEYDKTSECFQRLEKAYNKLQKEIF
ncbi:MAG: PAS domain-containing protein, partial [Candidatus Riflebacteria bacterium]|nr:PAS domain-containing protein [Candidatus Riflebacteria bacterium]